MSETAVSAFSPPESSADIDDLFSWRLGEDVDAGLEDIGRSFGINQRKLRLAAAENDREEPLEAIRDRFEGFLETFFGGFIDVLDRFLKVLDRVLEVGVLGDQVVVAFLELFELLDGHDIDFAQTADPFAQALDFFAQDLLFFRGHSAVTTARSSLPGLGR